MFIFTVTRIFLFLSALCHCWLDNRKGICPVKTFSSYPQTVSFADQGQTSRKFKNKTGQKLSLCMVCVYVPYYVLVYISVTKTTQIY